MRYGATNNPLKPIEEEIKAIGSLGFDYLELCLDPPEATPELLGPRLDEVRSALDREGLGLDAAHLPTFVWMADVYPSIRDASIRETEKAMDLCAEAGIQKAVLHPGYLTGMLAFSPALGREIAFESLARVLEYARPLGLTICLENLFPRSRIMHRPEEFTDVLGRYPEVMMTVDLGHAHIGAPPGGVVRMVEAGGERIRHVHVSDNNGGDDHLPVGAGRVDLIGGLSALKALGYDETITLEVFSPDRSYLRLSLEKVRAMWDGI